MKFKQVSIRGNHVAIVPAGRAGSSIKILDSKEAVVADPVAVVDAEVVEKQMSGWEKIFLKFGWKAPGQPTTDAESETVKKQEELARKANELKERTMDEEKEKQKQKDAEEAEKKKEKEATDAAEHRKATDARLATIADSLEKVVKALDKKSKDEDEEETEEQRKKREESEDADLIPVETMSGKEVPENPIPGADKALDALRALRPLVARSNDAKVIADYNNAVRALKGKTGTNDEAYHRAANSAELRTQDEDPTRRSKDNREDFVATAAKFHRRNAGEVLQLIRKEA